MRQQIAQHQIPRRASATQYPVEPVEEDDSYYPQRIPSSAIRYTTTEGHQVIQQGNKRIVIHEEEPSPKRRFHWLLYVGVVFFILPIRNYKSTVQVIPTGVRTYPALVAHGTLTITNGSVIAQILPAGFTSISSNGILVVTDRAVFVPPGNANDYGYATVGAHTLISGHRGNLPPSSINTVRGLAYTSAT